jgi:hypothetical protein
MRTTPEALKELKICDYEVEKAIWVPLKDYRSFAQSHSFGTQLEMALYIHDLYEQGYDFANPPSNYAYKHYKSPIDQTERFFGHHRLAPKA